MDGRPPRKTRCCRQKLKKKSDGHTQVSRATRHGASARSLESWLRTRREGASVHDSPRQGLWGGHHLPLAPRESHRPRLRLGPGDGDGQQAPLARPPQTSAGALPHRGRPRPRCQPAAEAHWVHYGTRSACARTLPTLSGSRQPEWPAGANPRARPGLAVALRACSHTHFHLGQGHVSAPSPPLSWILWWPRSPGTSGCVDARPLAVRKRVRPRLTRVTESTLKQGLAVQPAPGPSEVRRGTTRVGSAISSRRTWTPRPPPLPSRRVAQWSHAGAQVAHSARLPPLHPGPRTVIPHLTLGPHPAGCPC